METQTLAMGQDVPRRWTGSESGVSGVVVVVSGRSESLVHRTLVWQEMVSSRVPRTVSVKGNEGLELKMTSLLAEAMCLEM